MAEQTKNQIQKGETEPNDIPQWEQEGGAIPGSEDYALDRKRKNPRYKKVGLWLDRNKAVIVSVVDNTEARRIITSDMENYVLHSTIVPGDGAPENIRDRRYWNHLDEYYDKIVEHIQDAGEILIFGPEMAKYELQKRLEDAGLAGIIVSLEEAGRLSDLQIAAKVQKRFPVRSRFDIS